MTAVKAGDVERAVRRLDPSVFLLLFYGPDAGLVTERARAAAQGLSAGSDDPFQLVRLDGEVLESDPPRLIDEASTMGLFGGRRTVWVKPTTRNIARALEIALAADLQRSLIVVEAGDLGRTAPVRVACERSRRALALPCYPDRGRDLGRVVDEAFREAGLVLAGDSRAALLASLGSDRLSTRAEIEKLIMYARGQPEVTRADVDAIISDVAALALDAVVDAAFAGDLAQTAESLRRSRESGAAPSAVLGHALRHALLLLAAREDMAAAGLSASAAVERWRGLHFSRRDSVTRHLARWSRDSLPSVVERLQQGVLASRKAPPDLAIALAGGTFLAISAGPVTGTRSD